MTQPDFQTFIDGYSTADFNRIKFDWNGEHGDKFHDTNSEFRVQVCEFLAPNISTVKLDLIRDIYLEMAKSAKETWGVYNKFHLFGDELLKRGSTVYLMEYLEGASQSMDTYLASGRLTLTKEQARIILDFINKKLKEPLTERQRKLLQDIGQRRFEHIATQ